MYRIASIVEGKGEESALPVLLRRVLYELLEPPRFDIQFGRPLRLARGKIVNRENELERHLKLAAMDADAVLVVFDADDDLPCSLAPTILERAGRAIPCPVAVVIADREFESWFIAAGPSLDGELQLSIPEEPDARDLARRDAKGWLTEHMPGSLTYKPILHQERLAARMDLREARRRSPSFDKLVRVLDAISAQLAAP